MNTDLAISTTCTVFAIILATTTYYLLRFHCYTAAMLTALLTAIAAGIAVDAGRAVYHSELP